MITAPRYVVKDGTGEVVGDAIDISVGSDSYTKGNYAQALVRLVHKDEGGAEHGYALSFSRSRIMRSSGTHSFYIEPTCTGFPTHVMDNGAGDALEGMEPLFSASHIVVTEIDYGGYGTPLQLARLAPPGSSVMVENVYVRLVDNVCSAQWGQSRMRPIEVVVPDLDSQFTPPFGIYLE